MTYFEELLAINKKYFPDNNIRLKDLTEVYNLLDNFYSKEFNLDEFIKLCITLFSMQIFYDGNSRTIFEYLTTVLNRNNYAIDFSKIKENYQELRNLFPVIYDDDDQIYEDDIERVRKYIYPKERKEEEYDNSNNRTNRRR